MGAAGCPGYGLASRYSVTNHSAKVLVPNPSIEAHTSLVTLSIQHNTPEKSPTPGEIPMAKKIRFKNGEPSDEDDNDDKDTDDDE
ncbi:hypothetical protein GCM10009000_012760 [Halobacterium noricense]|uniref:Uncharacterized protein n=1 Tax=Haladaptatus pallidirubidus TaxID=1008152 RepID=A0AAV3UCB3_9EURY